MQWIDSLKIPEVAAALGIQISRGGFGPCPACGATRRSGSDIRPPCGMARSGAGWTCHACKGKGGAVDLIALRLFEERLEKGDPRWAELKTWVETQGLLQEGAAQRWQAPPEHRRPPATEVQALWAASTPPSASAKGGRSTLATLDFLTRRGHDLELLARSGVARLLPDPKAHAYPDWWPAAWAPTWRLAVQAFTGRGQAVSLHARAVVDAGEGKPKTRWPHGYEAAGLLFASRLGEQLLRGDPAGVRALLVVEGMTDFLAASVAVERLGLPLAVLGGTSGSWSGLQLVKLPRSVEVYVAMDMDPVGDRYAIEIARALRPARVRRIPLRQVEPAAKDLDDVLQGSSRSELILRLLDAAAGAEPIHVEDEEGPHPDVMPLLAMGKGGTPKTSFANVYEIILYDPRWLDLRFNELGDMVEWKARREKEAILVAEACAWLARHYQLHAGTQTVRDAVYAVAQQRAYHPVQEYLRGLRWDGEARICHVLTQILGCPDDPLHQLYIRRFLLSAVARAMEPGCKVDTALVFVGAQGAMKSSFFRVMFGTEWFGDSPIPIGDKDAAIQLRSVWGYEAAEMEDLSRKTAEAVKQFLSTARDLYRPLWERAARHQPRHSVLCGTTNRTQFLNDETGHRRFWPLLIPDDVVINLRLAEAWRDQLWAETMAIWERYLAARRAGQEPASGDRWWFTREEEADRQADVEQFVEVDPWDDSIRQWLTGQGFGFTMAELLSGALKLDPRDHNVGVARRAGRVLRQMGWTSTTVWDNNMVVRRWRRVSDR